MLSIALNCYLDSVMGFLQTLTLDTTDDGYIWFVYKTLFPFMPHAPVWPLISFSVLFVCWTVLIVILGHVLGNLLPAGVCLCWFPSSHVRNVGTTDPCSSSPARPARWRLLKTLEYKITETSVWNAFIQNVLPTYALKDWRAAKWNCMFSFGSNLCSPSVCRADSWKYYTDVSPLGSALFRPRGR